MKDHMVSSKVKEFESRGIEAHLKLYFNKTENKNLESE